MTKHPILGFIGFMAVSMNFMYFWFHFAFALGQSIENSKYPNFRISPDFRFRVYNIVLPFAWLGKWVGYTNIARNMAMSFENFISKPLF